MLNFTDLASVPSHPLAPFTDRLRLAVAAYLARFKGSSREHTESDLRCYPGLVRRARPGPAGRAAPAPGAVHPVDAGDPPVQALHRVPAVLSDGRVLPDLRPGRRLAAFARRARAPPSGARRIADPGFTHLQFEALLTAARESANPSDFALVAMLGLLGLRIFEATSADIADLGEEHGHRVLRVCGKGTKIVLVPLPPAVGRAIDRAVGLRDQGPIPARAQRRRGAGWLTAAPVSHRQRTIYQARLACRGLACRGTPDYPIPSTAADWGRAAPPGRPNSKAAPCSVAGSSATTIPHN
jgi:integrase/recombinase XerD